MSASVLPSLSVEIGWWLIYNRHSLSLPLSTSHLHQWRCNVKYHASLCRRTIRSAEECRRLFTDVIIADLDEHIHMGIYGHLSASTLDRFKYLITYVKETQTLRGSFPADSRRLGVLNIRNTIFEPIYLERTEKGHFSGSGSRMTHLSRRGTSMASKSLALPRSPERSLRRSCLFDCVCHRCFIKSTSRKLQ